MLKLKMNEQLSSPVGRLTTELSNPPPAPVRPKGPIKTTDEESTAHLEAKALQFSNKRARYSQADSEGTMLKTHRDQQ